MREVFERTIKSTKFHPILKLTFDEIIKSEISIKDFIKSATAEEANIFIGRLPEYLGECIDTTFPPEFRYNISKISLVVWYLLQANKINLTPETQVILKSVANLIKDTPDTNLKISKSISEFADFFENTNTANIFKIVSASLMMWVQTEDYSEFSTSEIIRLQNLIESDIDFTIQPAATDFIGKFPLRVIMYLISTPERTKKFLEINDIVLISSVLKHTIAKLQRPKTTNPFLDGDQHRLQMLALCLAILDKHPMLLESSSIDDLKQLLKHCFTYSRQQEQNIALKSDFENFAIQLIPRMGKKNFSIEDAYLLGSLSNDNSQELIMVVIECLAGNNKLTGAVLDHLFKDYYGCTPAGLILKHTGMPNEGIYTIFVAAFRRYIHTPDNFVFAKVLRTFADNAAGFEHFIENIYDTDIKMGPLLQYIACNPSSSFPKEFNAWRYLAKQPDLCDEHISKQIKESFTSMQDIHLVQSCICAPSVIDSKSVLDVAYENLNVNFILLLIKRFARTPNGAVEENIPDFENGITNTIIKLSQKHDKSLLMPIANYLYYTRNLQWRSSFEQNLYNAITSQDAIQVAEVVADDPLKQANKYKFD